jgi:ABC-type phosphate transport system ATPase subunit
MKNLLFATVLLAGLPGCALLRSQVAVVHQLPTAFSGTTYVMIPFKEQEGSLEHKAYEEVVRQELNAKGLRETTVDQAQIVFFLLMA